MITAPFVRIALRYGSAFLMAKGFFGDDAVGFFVDEEVIGLAVAVLNEAWYLAARRFGWEK